MCPSSGETTVCMRHLVLDKIVSADDGHIVVRNMYRKEINILRQIVHRIGFIYKILLFFSCYVFSCVGCYFHQQSLLVVFIFDSFVLIVSLHFIMRYLEL